MLTWLFLHIFLRVTLSKLLLVEDLSSGLGCLNRSVSFERDCAARFNLWFFCWLLPGITEAIINSLHNFLFWMLSLLCKTDTNFTCLNLQVL